MKKTKERTTRIRIKQDGRELVGTSLQIVQAMQYIAFERQRVPTADYIAWIADQLSRLDGLASDMLAGRLGFNRWPLAHADDG